MGFGERLKNLRISYNLTQRELADKLIVSRSTIGKWESGHAFPDLDKLIMISRFFQCSSDYLLGLSDIPTINTDSCNYLTRKIYELLIAEALITPGEEINAENSEYIHEQLKTAFLTIKLIKRLSK